MIHAGGGPQAIARAIKEECYRMAQHGPVRILVKDGVPVQSIEPQQASTQGAQGVEEKA